MKINFLSHKEINKVKWDECISAAFNGNLYGFSWYLDAVCEGWNALATDDYSMVMPLTGNKKYGFNYLFRPLLSQQLGIFSSTEINPSLTEEFLIAIPSKYKLVQYCLNKSNVPPDSFDPIYHTSYELDLGKGYEALKSGYTENHKRNLKKAEAMGSVLRDDISVEEFFILMLKDDSPGSKILLDAKNRKLLERLTGVMEEKKACRIIGLDNADGKLIAAVLFGYIRDTWYYLAPVSNEEGKEKRAHFLIIDHMIRVNSGKPELLDFEGSDIEGVARFYSGFGAKAIQYAEIRKNNLPWPIKYLK